MKQKETEAYCNLVHEIKWSNLDLSNEQAESIVDEFNLMGMKRIDGDVLGSREITVTPQSSTLEMVIY